NVIDSHFIDDSDHWALHDAVRAKVLKRRFACCRRKMMGLTTPRTFRCTYGPAPRPVVQKAFNSVHMGRRHRQ
ncbi:hypothetical protein, partial [Nevskia sp.]|uniref:hypothetical protein n=1 Tax=Nevskia sp. TaxID=1929292 RepID=UPI0025F1C114